MISKTFKQFLKNKQKNESINDDVKRFNDEKIKALSKNKRIGDLI